MRGVVTQDMGMPVLRLCSICFEQAQHCRLTCCSQTLVLSQGRCIPLYCYHVHYCCYQLANNIQPQPLTYMLLQLPT